MGGGNLHGLQQHNSRHYGTTCEKHSPDAMTGESERHNTTHGKHDTAAQRVRNTTPTQWRERVSNTYYSSATPLEQVRMNAEKIYERIQTARDKSGRTDKIYFVAVSKTHTVDEMHEAEKFPCIDYFGENRVQEAEAKRKTYGTSRIPWRLIGHLQANKARKALELFDTIDSVDTPELATRLNRIAGELGKNIPVLIEVNTSGEDSKSGVDPENFSQLLDVVREQEHLRLDGLMTIGPITDDESKIRRAFANLRGLCENARTSTGLALPVLSMGMSGDFESAILEGSTMVRIGTLLFGARVYS